VPSQGVWHFDNSNFASNWQRVSENFAGTAERPIWLFQSGWIDDKEDAWIANLRQFGCTDAHNFGPNIFVCRLQLPSRSSIKP
jgi:hypothetical protein